MKPVSPDSVVRVLLPEPGGLSAPEIRRRLRQRISQPTLWRLLDKLRSEGRVTIEGRARATRYHAATPLDLASRRSLQMHRAVARRIARHPELIDVTRERLECLRRINPHGAMYHDRWSELIASPLPVLLRAMTEDSDAGATLRKESPFTILVTHEDRRRAFADVR